METDFKATRKGEGAREVSSFSSGSETDWGRAIKMKTRKKKWPVKENTTDATRDRSPSRKL